MRAVVLAAVIASLLFAQSIDPRYEIIGAFNGVIGETSPSLTSLNDLEKNRSMVKRRDTRGFTTVR